MKKRAIVGSYSSERAARDLHPFELLGEGGEHIGWLDTGVPGTWGHVEGTTWEEELGPSVEALQVKK